MLNLSKAYTPKQIEILRACRNTDWFLLINHGQNGLGKRSWIMISSYRS